MSLNDKQIKALFERGNNFVRVGNLPSAIQDYTAVIQALPNFAPAYFNRGFAYHQGGADLQTAIADYDTALHLKPDYTQGYINRAIAYSQQGNYDAALADYSAALGLDDTRSQAYVNRGELYLLRGDYPAAEADFRRAQTLKVGYRYAIAGLALSLHAQGQVDEAVQVWQTLITRDPNFKDPDWVRDELTWDDTLVELARRLMADFPA